MQRNDRKSCGRNQCTIQDQSDVTPSSQLTTPDSALMMEAIGSGCTAADIDRQEGKSALHVAAWKGSLENVQYLVQDLGCNVNSYSTGEFNYGKTAIFYAATQSRVDVVDYLLQQNAKVTIVNNKGQSVLSICASHDMPASLLERIQALEQQHDDWWNFRTTHSDGLEYGDLDPRFLDRPLRDSDVVTPWAINPTSKETRKGGFARRNPEKYHQLTNRKPAVPKKQRNQHKRRQAAELTQREQEELAVAWEALGASPVWNGPTQEAALQTIVTLGDKQFQPWIPEAADKLSYLVDSGTCARDQIIITLDRIGQQHSNDEDGRFSALIQKLLTRFQKLGKEEEDADKEVPVVGIHKSPPVERFDWDSEPWKTVRQDVQELSISMLEGSNILQLSQPVCFVDTLDQLEELQSRLKSATVLALDTEWYDAKENKVALATLQVAMVTSTGNIVTWVVDLLVQDDLYQKAARALAEGIFASTTVLLGFAFGNDMPYLESFAGRSLSGDKGRVFDIQHLLAGRTARQLPGLKHCAARFSNVPLSKDQQCSMWCARPLSAAQLKYAGLDAAILLVLLAEHLRSEASDI